MCSVWRPESSRRYLQCRWVLDRDHRRGKRLTGSPTSAKKSRRRRPAEEEDEVSTPSVLSYGFPDSAFCHIAAHLEFVDRRCVGTSIRGEVAPRAGFEPATLRLGGECSIRLSYRGVSSARQHSKVHAASTLVANERSWSVSPVCAARL